MCVCVVCVCSVCVCSVCGCVHTDAKTLYMNYLCRSVCLQSHTHTWFTLHSKFKALAWLEIANLSFLWPGGGGRGGRSEGGASGRNKLEGAVFQSFHSCTVQCPGQRLLSHICQFYHLRDVHRTQWTTAISAWRADLNVSGNTAQESLAINDTNMSISCT